MIDTELTKIFDAIQKNGQPLELDDVSWGGEKYSDIHTIARQDGAVWARKVANGTPGKWTLLA